MYIDNYQALLKSKYLFAAEKEGKEKRTQHIGYYCARFI